MKIGDLVVIKNTPTSYNGYEGEIVHLFGRSMISDDVFDYGVQFCKDGWIVGFKEKELECAVYPTQDEGGKDEFK